MLENVRPMDIERRSFEIITELLGDRQPAPEIAPVVKRVIHTQMAKAGVNKTILARLGGEVHCFISDPDVAGEARDRGVTRAAVSMERAAALGKRCVFAIGNAPTALLALAELMDRGELDPALVIGVPVGFVNVVESKERILASAAPHIVARGRKGGSNVAAAICNALLYQIER